MGILGQIVRKKENKFYNRGWILDDIKNDISH